jgi:UDP-2,3-diacylglucosamine hydrolase
MPHTLFISDLHLSPERPHINETFFRFLRDTAARAEALHVLGDLFENWVGDDDLADPFNAAIADALRQVSRSGVMLTFMKGNRDVLADEGFAARCGAGLIADPTLVDLYGTRTLLMHGDTLCTDDAEYQKFRVIARDPAFQKRFLSQPIAERKKQMLDMRMKSEQHKQGQAAEIMDVAPATVEKVLREFGYPRLIHGHTHRPARHLHTVDGHRCERWVLNDWYQRGGFLRCDSGGCKTELL